jgi:hypothetical protein
VLAEGRIKFHLTSSHQVSVIYSDAVANFFCNWGINVESAVNYTAQETCKSSKLFADLFFIHLG